MKTLAHLLQDNKTSGLSESILKDIELIEQIHLRFAYLEASNRVPFDEWYEATFNTITK